jgi:hypothetical protein
MPRTKILLPSISESEFLLLKEILLQLDRRAQVIRLTNDDGLYTYLSTIVDTGSQPLIILYQPRNLNLTLTKIQEVSESWDHTPVLAFIRAENLHDLIFLPKRERLYTYRIPTNPSDYKRILKEFLTLCTLEISQQPVENKGQETSN